MERLQKVIASTGYCSRRKAEELIKEGKVMVDNEIITTLGHKVLSNAEIIIEGVLLEKENKVYFLLNKPRGVISSVKDDKKRTTVVDLIDTNIRVYPVGRLDKDSDGLILLTNNGEITDKILRSVNGHEKEYVVKVNKKITDTFLKSMAEGVYLKELDVTTKPCSISRINNYTFRIILTQGLNRQIRRMCQESGYKVESLTRVRIMNIELGGLKIGEYRIIEGKEKTMLYESLWWSREAVRA